MEIIQGIVEAAEQENAPVILQVSAGARKYAKSAYLTSLVDAAIKDTGVDVVLHLDHGDSFEPVSYTHLDVYKRQDMWWYDIGWT